VGASRCDLLEGLHARAERPQLVRVHGLAHLGEHLALLVLDVVADLAHELGELVVEARVVRVELLEPLQRLLGLCVLLARVLDLFGADLALCLRVDDHFLGDRVPDEFDRDLLRELLAARPLLVGRGAAEPLELAEHLLDLAMVVLEYLDHVTLLFRHSRSSWVGSGPGLPGRLSQKTLDRSAPWG
jgi:hypothetical protein